MTENLRFEVEIEPFTARAMAKAYDMNEQGMAKALQTIVLDALSKKFNWKVTGEEVKTRARMAEW